MKKALLIMLMACLLGLAVGCSSSQPAKKDSGPAMDIKLSSEEVEYQGAHVRIPDSLKMERNELGEYHSVHYTNEPITGEVSLSMWIESAEAINEGGAYEDSVSGKYTPEEALISAGYQESNEYWTFENKRVGGTDAIITRGTEGGFESTQVTLVLNSGLLSIKYGDRGDKYNDLIQESIDSIRVDEELIPDIVRITSPESLKAAGLREQPWEITCDPYGIYVNMPEDFTPVKRDDGNYVWTSPDMQTMVSSSVVSSDFLRRDEEAFASTLAGNPGFTGFDFFTRGNYRGMYFTEFKYKATGSDGNDVWNYALALLPWKYGKEAILLNIVSYDAERAELQEVIDTARFADGFNNGGVLDMETLAVPAN